MPLPNPKLKKLTIKAYSSNDRSDPPLGTFEAMYNPASFSQKYEISYGKNQGFNSSGRSAIYSHSKPRVVTLKLILDGTGVIEVGPASVFNGKTVSERVKDFINLTFGFNNQIHEPNYLIFEWGGEEDGGLIFTCRLETVNVTYTSFNRDGTPLRAELDISLIGDEDVEKRIKKEGKSSPDLSHSWNVRAGDTLPLLSKKIYGSSQYYLLLAQFNNLNNFRNLTPGQELTFPPLGNDGTGND